MNRERCPVCHRQAPVNSDGRFAFHGIRSSAQANSAQRRGCSGEGLPGQELAGKLKHQEQTRAVVLALAQFVMAFDLYDGLYSGSQLTPKSKLGMIDGARDALFNICTDQPELLEGTNLTVQAWDAEAVKVAGLIEGPKS